MFSRHEIFCGRTYAFTSGLLLLLMMLSSLPKSCALMLLVAWEVQKTNLYSSDIRDEEKTKLQ